MSDKPMYVYIIEAIGADIIKVGVTIDVHRRLRGLQGCFPYKLKLLAIISGGVEVERKLHRLFHEHQFRGEWFAAQPIRDWVAAGCVIPSGLPPVEPLTTDRVVEPLEQVDLTGGVRTKLDHVLAIRMTPAMYQAVVLRSKSEGLTVSDWMRRVLNRAST